MKHAWILALSMAVAAMADAARSPRTLNLWDGDPPSIVQHAGPGESYAGGSKVKDVGIPTLSLYFPEDDNPERPVLLICPGGGYHHLTRLDTGNGAVDRFLPRGVVVAVLKYRTRPPYPNVDEIALADVRRAVRLLRSHAGEWGIDPQRVGVIGWSAGANLTLNLATHFDTGDPASPDTVERESSRPDVVALLCPWPWKKTIGDYPTSPETPPAFIASARDDKTAPASFAQAIAKSWDANAVPCELWIIDTGGHGAFSAPATGEGSRWDERFWFWLTSHFPQWES
jgi:endo-1,4-beta-xylanase